MSLKKILTQKLRNPKTKDWIETSYVAADDATSNNPVIYMHGTLADNNVIEERHIQENAVGSFQLAPNAVDSEKIAPDAVNSEKIAPNAVGSDEIASGAVGSDEIASGAVGSDEIAPGAVDVSKLAPNVREMVEEVVIIGSNEPSSPSTRIWIKI